MDIFDCCLFVLVSFWINKKYCSVHVLYSHLNGTIITKHVSFTMGKRKIMFISGIWASVTEKNTLILPAVEIPSLPMDWSFSFSLFWHQIISRLFSQYQILFVTYFRRLITSACVCWGLLVFLFRKSVSCLLKLG